MVFQAEGLNRIIALLKCLVAFSEITDCTTPSSIGFNYNLSAAEHDRINGIYNYSLRHFNQKIYLNEIANLANLAPNSFCRYFKLKTGKTYSNFLTEIRIGYACKLLLDDKKSVKQICYESGFDNFSCLHKKF
jgi:AraC-like DNA-binding protein